MRALVTGANGFLGRHVVGALLARGIEVRAMVRPATRLEAVGWPSSVEVFRADLATGPSKEGILAGGVPLVRAQQRSRSSTCPTSQAPASTLRAAPSRTASRSGLRPICL